MHDQNMSIAFGKNYNADILKRSDNTIGSINSSEFTKKLQYINCAHTKFTIHWCFHHASLMVSPDGCWFSAVGAVLS